MHRRAIWGAFVSVVLVGSVSAAAASAGSPAGIGARPVIRPSQELAVLLHSQRVFSGINGHPRKTGAIQVSRPITGARTVLPVVRHVATPDGVDWLRVKLPGRPNGKKGWIRERGTVAAQTLWHVVVHTGSRRVRVFREGELVRTLVAIVGKPSTPTPHGRFFVEESVDMLPGAVGGPFALALSARSKVLQEFEGGPGQIAIHGVENLGGTFGTASSHGCVRLRNRGVRWLAAHVGIGSPVTIVR